MAKSLTVQEFFKQFPDDAACLEHLMVTRFGRELSCPTCDRTGKFLRLTNRPAYSCPFCGHHVYPMAGTPFQDSHTPLQKWFYAMYLFTTSRHGVPAKELQRQLGVTYKTAWRIGHQIRLYMGAVDGNEPLGGTVEADETLVGGIRKGKRGRGAAGKTVVFGMLERDGDVMTEVVPNVQRATLHPLIEESVLPGSTLQTDELLSYQTIATKGFNHVTVNHGRGEYVRGTAHTNTIEGFWSQLKRSINGTHIHVSSKHLPKYLGGFEFRYNMRKEPQFMFSRLLAGF